MNVIEKDVNEDFPLFRSPHEGYAVIKEEIEETMDAMNWLTLNS